MIELWLVRHGETDWNVARRIQGQTDIPLNAHGIQQAETLARQLRDIPFRAIITSDLSRARRTAEALQTAVAAKVFMSSLLRERSFGTAEGHLRSEFGTDFPRGIPGVETDDELVQRASRFLSLLTKSIPHGRVLCVSHGGLIRRLLYAMDGSMLPFLANVSICKAVWAKKIWHVKCSNVRTNGEAVPENPVFIA